MPPHRARVVAVAVIAALVPALSGCFVLTRTDRALVQRRVDRGAPQVEDHGLRVEAAEFSERAISVRLGHRRHCTYPLRETSQHRVSKRLRLWAPAFLDDGFGLFVVVVFSIYTVPISALVSGITVAVSADRTEVAVVELPAERVACDAAVAGLGVWLAVRDQPVVHATTDSEGVARFLLGGPIDRGDALVGIDGLTAPTWPPPRVVAPPPPPPPPSRPSRRR